MKKGLMKLKQKEIKQWIYITAYAMLILITIKRNKFLAVIKETKELLEGGKRVDGGKSTTGRTTSTRSADHEIIH